MPIVVANKRSSYRTLTNRYPDMPIIDITSRGSSPWIKFSPFYPHGAIPVPFSPGYTAASVEGIWQGLKVFAHADIDVGQFANTSMRGIKRTSRINGAVLGHRAGVHGTSLLSYLEARRTIYLPAYHWVLATYLQEEVRLLRQLHESGTVILLDYETNQDITNVATPLSHAGLVSAYVRGDWPDNALGYYGMACQVML